MAEFAAEVAEDGLFFGGETGKLAGDIGGDLGKQVANERVAGVGEADADVAAVGERASAVKLAAMTSVATSP